MNETGKWTTAGATLGGLIAAIVAVALKGSQVDIADHWALTIGGVTYSKTELIAIYDTPVGGDDSVSLAHQLISALLAHQSYLYESLSAKENLDVVARILGRDNEREILERVGLAQRADDPVATFSAGMRKRLSFARVLLQRPEVVFFEEPYGQLDPEGFRLVDTVVQELKASGATVLLATHQVDRVVGYADCSITLEAGRIIATEGTLL